jgi:hypothetical protein
LILSLKRGGDIFNFFGAGTTVCMYISIVRLIVAASISEMNVEYFKLL